MNLLWDQDEYINAVVYEFTNESILGVSNLPYDTLEHNLEGLLTAPVGINHSNLGYPHCLSINNECIYVDNSSNPYDTVDSVVTFTHELGHYLGLLHSFSINSTYETDYCEDTKTYDRFKYESELVFSTSRPFTELVKRYDFDGNVFISHNIMDYYFSYFNKFTPDQIARMQYVVDYSPLIPSLNKKSRTTGRGITGILDLPVRVIE